MSNKQISLAQKPPDILEWEDLSLCPLSFERAKYNEYGKQQQNNNKYN